MKQVRLVSHDANLVIGDLDALGEGAQVISPIAASFDPQAPACRLRKGVDHLRCHGPIAGAVECHPYPLGIGRGLIADRFQIGDRVFQSHVVQRCDA
ncbi:hypothetical protein BSZ14_13455 [Sphingomonas sp. Sph1(2015)]|uniref:hypothetical protein n=1 Tax=Sphingomonas sp. Sph1(2015) TaxID=1628084 RepID=UPI000975B42A|nr:hypothetical protein [Sphingomonas sp. Sph1(2015)]OMJ31445.1 hypothetical protein BSZ14_13455 [Sphingomonas sp. Sph1(2015)]